MCFVAFAASTSALGTIAGGALGAVGGAVVGGVAGPIGAVAGGVAGFSATTAMAAEAETDYISDFAKLVSDINTLTDELGAFVARAEDGAGWVRNEISNLDDKQLES